MLTTEGPRIKQHYGFPKKTFEELPPAIRNPFCRRYERCLNEAARHDVKDFDCGRCYFRHDKSAARETGLYAPAYLDLARVIMQGSDQQIGLPRKQIPGSKPDSKPFLW